MTRAQFDDNYSYVFKKSDIFQYIYKERKEFGDIIKDTAAYVESYYERDRAFSVAYTPHDWKRHIINVISNADLILHDYKAFGVNDLFCFLMAVILHDIGMVYKTDTHRAIHALVGAEMVCKIVDSNKKRHPIYNKIALLRDEYKDKFDLDNEYIVKLTDGIQGAIKDVSKPLQKEIAAIVLGHSDLKFSNYTGDPKDTVKTLDTSLYRIFTTNSSTINALAAILRWADELDLSQSRCEGIHLDELPEDSKPFWKKLKLINSVIINPGKITLNVETDLFDEGEAEKKEIEDPYQLLKEIIDKLKKEQTTCNTLFDEIDKRNLSFPVISTECIEPTDIREALEAYCEKKAINQPSENYEYYHDSNNNEKLTPEDLKKSIREYIDEHHLYKEGHYCLHRTIEGDKEKRFCIRNVLDCNGLLSSHKLLDDIAQELLLQINNDEDYNDYALIGIANSGALLAAHIAGLSGLPIAHWVPNNKKVKYTKQERDLEFIKTSISGKKIVLVIGVNHTGKAILDACNSIGNVKHVIGIINREMPSVEGLKKQLEKKGIQYYFLVEEKYIIDRCRYSEENKECPYKNVCTSIRFDPE
ncbi:HD domain-containing protein [Aristaeella hokkaidonensis]|uniref:HD domain-containing protein n=1 Tax=Aristaeella hokkaidonensis TaxID=3046382 RepID=A0AC61N722_9FIRM|nr:HD domain-containing protein [Aristaeella hokkaidonensis]QUC66356.1 HD domain-containing protein [Aristaeella hokkaidonensis]SNT94233.1 Orotate phosphoribosyltransferase [Aristaeella hokkaidonensis]